MKKTNLLGTTLFSLALLASCNSVEETPGAFSTLQVKVTNNTPESRAIVTGTTLPAGSEIGVTLLDAAGQNYDDVPYANLKYTTANGTDWAVSGATAPLLSSTDGKTIAYYPWKDAADYTALAVETASQTDYMYSGWVEGINNSAPEASFTMNHGLSAFRVILKKEDAYKAVATATTVSVKSDAFVASAKMNAVDGALSAWSGEGNVTVDMADITLSTTDQYTDIMVVPAQAAGTKATFTVAVEDAGSNSKNYTVDVPFTTAMLQGKCYQFTLTLTATGFEASTVAVTEWGQVTNAGSGSLVPQSPWDAVAYINPEEAANGVYAVAPNGKVLTDLTSINEEMQKQCIAVALIQGEHKFMIAKSDATNDGSNLKLYFDYNKDEFSITNYTNADNTNSSGYLGGELSGDFTTWTAGALSDFNGKTNTAVIAAASSDAKDMCTVLNSFNTGTNSQSNEGFHDWYIPAFGQLALMYLNKTEINEALAKIGGTAFSNTSNGYWSSSQCNSEKAWAVFFGDGFVSARSKIMSGLIRFIRDIE